MEKIIEFKNVDYKTQKQKAESPFILKDISLEINKGEFICVVGFNGCGKSTLVKLMSGLLSPSSGSIIVCGLDTQSPAHLQDIRKKVGIIFQNPDNQIISNTVEEEIAFGLENLCIAREDILVRIKNALYAVEMEGFEKNLTSELSGGQKQRLNIASVLAMKPEVIVLDEPTSMLDSTSRKNFLNLLLEIKSSNNATIILVTHFMEEAIFSDRVVYLENKRLKFVGDPYELFSSETFLKDPCITPMQSSQILKFIENLGYPVSMRALKTESCAKEIINILEYCNKND